MSLLDGIHHVATLTADLTRLISFYERVFEGSVVLDLEEEGLRHAFIALGAGMMLHPFQVPGVEVPSGDIPIFARGRIDHIGFKAASGAAFWELRRRAMSEGAGDGVVTEIGPTLSFSLADPDGVFVEVLWDRPDVPLDDSIRRANWRTVDAP